MPLLRWYKSLLLVRSASFYKETTTVGLAVRSGGHGGSFDAWVALTVPLGCVALLVEAYFRSHTTGSDTTADARFAASEAYMDTPVVVSLSSSAPSSSSSTAAAVNGDWIVRELSIKGIVVIPNAISHEILIAARDEIGVLVGLSCCPDDTEKNPRNTKDTTDTDKPRYFETGANDEDVRQDSIIWIQQDTPSATYLSLDNENVDSALPVGLDFCVQFLRGIPFALEQHGYTTTTTTASSGSPSLGNKNDTSNDWVVPRQCQLAMYKGDGKASYERHLDKCNASVYELGMLEYMRLREYRQRCLTVILYLNEPDRLSSHGGALRCWVAKNNDDVVDNNINSDAASSLRRTNAHDQKRNAFHPPFDVQPQGGTLVIFQSDRVDHQVLPSTVDRFALTNWVASRRD